MNNSIQKNNQIVELFNVDTVVSDALNALINFCNNEEEVISLKKGKTFLVSTGKGGFTKHLIGYQFYNQENYTGQTTRKIRQL